MGFSVFRNLRRFCNYTRFSDREILLYLSDNTCTHKKCTLLMKHVDQRFVSFSCHRLNYDSIVPKIENSKVVSNNDADLQEFNCSYEIIRKAILHADDKVLQDAANWNAKILDYNSQGGKKTRGLTVLKAYKLLAEENISAEGRLQACILGWCVEMLQAFLVICDDIMDNSTTRRGKLCWYKKPNIGLTAINDGLLLECSIYKILEIYFSKTEVYNNLVHEFLKVTRNTVYGQCLDTLNVPTNQRPRFDNFTQETYETLVKYKTSYYTFCHPVHLAMHLIGNCSPQDFESTRNICFKLGLLFQIQDDYLDVFGDPEVTGKIGTDIADGKCNWFAATLFECASDPMKKIMMENYGVNDKDSISKVMKLYEELDVEEKFRECEEALVQDIKSLINNTLERSSMKTLFSFLLQKIYRRKK